MIIYRGKKYKVVKAAGFRLGIGYLPSHKNNKDIDPGQARHLIVWCGPYFVTRSLPAPRGYVPRLEWDPDRLEELDKARADMTLEIARALRAKKRWQNHMNFGMHYGMGQANLDMMADFDAKTELHPDVRRRWQAESDAVKLREMEQNDGNS